jgi:hypothetical protein
MSMTHTNRDEPEWLLIRDWLELLNWSRDEPEAQMRVWLPQIHSQRLDRALFLPRDAVQLRIFVNAWIAAERDLRQMQLPPEEAAILRQYANGPVQAYLTISVDGKFAPYWIDDTSVRPFHVAVALFVRIVMHPDNWLLNGPCPNCRKYFVRKTRRDSRYHPDCRRCESGPRMQRHRRQEHLRLLALAQEGICEYLHHARREEWKVWIANYICRRAHQPITTKSLTRWVNNGELEAPSKTTRKNCS